MLLWTRLRTNAHFHVCRHDSHKQFKWPIVWAAPVSVSSCTGDWKVSSRKGDAAKICHKKKLSYFWIWKKEKNLQCVLIRLYPNSPLQRVTSWITVVHSSWFLFGLHSAKNLSRVTTNWQLLACTVPLKKKKIQFCRENRMWLCPACWLGGEGGRKKKKRKSIPKSIISSLPHHLLHVLYRYCCT